MTSVEENKYIDLLKGEGLPTTASIGKSGFMPSCFRTSRVLPLPTSENPINKAGLETLNLSGSAQFSELELDTIISTIGNKNITIVNLRQEDAGFLKPKTGKGMIPFSYI